MRVQTEEWRRFIPGIRMYKGKKTLFYNGEELYDDERDEYLVYDKEERNSWEVIIVLPGVEVIASNTFSDCIKLETVIMADTVRRIEREAFEYCESLAYVRLSTNLEFIGVEAFCDCTSLTSIFIPPSCRQIGRNAFSCCHRLMILHVPQQTRLAHWVIVVTALVRASPATFETDHMIDYNNTEEVNNWIKNLNMTQECELHRACSSYNPMHEIVYGIVKRKGLKAFHKKNEIGITPLQYLKANPFADIDEKKIVKRYILEMIGEVV